jgi:thiol-disulfide isomerase/thioredoxin
MSLSKKSKRSLLAAVGLILLIAGIAAGMLRLSPAKVPAAGWVFELSFPNPQGEAISLQAVRGRLTVVNFWATWCPPCVEEMPELSALHAELGGRVRMVGIGIDSPGKIAEFASKKPVTYPLVVAGMSGTELARQFGNTSGALPFTVLIGRQGRIAQRILGRIDLARLRPIALELAA